MSITKTRTKNRRHSITNYKYAELGQMMWDKITYDSNLERNGFNPVLCCIKIYFIYIGDLLCVLPM